MNPRKSNPGSIALHNLILTKSKLKNGFTRTHAEGLKIDYSLIGKRTQLMINEGILHLGTVRGQSKHYFATEQAARVWEAAQPPYKYKRTKVGIPTSKHKQTENSLALLAVILKNGATPAGFITEDRPDCIRRTSVWARCAAMVQAGQLFVATRERGESVYFTTQAGADACRLEFLARVEAKKVTATQKRKASAEKVMAEKVAAIPRRAYVPPVKREIEIIYPECYKHSYHPMPAQRNQAVSHSFVHPGVGAM